MLTSKFYLQAEEELEDLLLNLKWHKWFKGAWYTFFSIFWNDNFILEVTSFSREQSDDKIRLEKIGH